MTHAQRRLRHPLRAHVSLGNTMLGSIANISLTPDYTCSEDMPCRTACYAQRCYERWPDVRMAWDANFVLAMTNPEEYFGQIIAEIKRRQVKYFRWHVGGDIIGQWYLEGMKRVARECDKTKFLCYTKRVDLDFSGLPANLVIRVSMWPGWGNPSATELPKAWIQVGDEPDPRMPADAYRCDDSNVLHCTECLFCWRSKRDVVFRLRDGR